MSVPQFARALETLPGPQPRGPVRRVPSPPLVYAVLPAPLAIALIIELRRASQSVR